MSKAVLISIRPKWCELIASGEKSIEVRKTRPKIETPFKCYIYCTNVAPYLNRHNGKLYLGPKDSIGGQGYGLYERLSGKVIGEFVCDRIIEWHYIQDPDESADPGSMAYDVLTVDGEKTGLEYDDFEDYGKGAPLFGWRISNLVIYDEPKKLSEFYRWNDGTTDIRPCENGKPCEHLIFDYSEDHEACGIDYDGENCPFLKVTRPPQSYCFVEELE